MKKILVLLLSAIMVFVFCSCGELADNNQDQQELYNQFQTKLENGINKMSEAALSATDSYGLKIALDANAELKMGTETQNVSANALLQLFLDFGDIKDSKALAEIEMQMPRGSSQVTQNVGYYITDEFMYANTPDGKMKNPLDLSMINVPAGENYIEELLAFIMLQSGADFPNLEEGAGIEDIFNMLGDTEDMSPVAMLFLDCLADLEVEPYDILTFSVSQTKITASLNYTKLKNLITSALASFESQLTSYTDVEASFPSEIMANEKFAQIVNKESFYNLLDGFYFGYFQSVLVNLFTNVENIQFVELTQYINEEKEYDSFDAFVNDMNCDSESRKLMSEWFYNEIGIQEFCTKLDCADQYEQRVDNYLSNLYIEMSDAIEDIDTITSYLPEKFVFNVEIGFTSGGMLQSFDLELDMVLKLPSDFVGNNNTALKTTSTQEAATLVEIGIKADLSITVETGITAEDFEFPADLNSYMMPAY